MGGTSRHGLEWARALAHAGAQVDVVTANPGDYEPWQACTPAGRISEDDSLTVHYATATDRRYTVPDGTPWVSLILGVAYRLVERRHFDAIVAFPLEPYGVAGLLLSRETGTPLYISHAGSDLFDLAGDPQLGQIYRRVVEASRRVICTLAGAKVFLQLGAIPEQLAPLQRLDYRFPTRGPFDEVGPLKLLHYGKLAPAKRIVELIRGVGDASAHGREVHLTLVGRGPKGVSDVVNREVELATEKGASIYHRDFVGMGEVAELLSVHDCGVTLEDAAHNAGHVSSVPAEIVAAGACLVASTTAVQRAWPLREAAVDKLNSVIVDMRRYEQLVETIEWCADHRSSVHAIGLRAQSAFARADRPGLTEEALGSYLLELLSPQATPASSSSEVLAFQLLSEVSHDS
ncbi:glycosyltransferase [Plantibacter sp. CFBP 8798]|uniref:glycosyltransferase n=1 Tax=Plantibacter sp. CFBP 8798 TaxID=2775268 RepID=UPI0020182A40|nr:glycosyltransferase [Plantibacter sp. CFBP 8798]